MESREETTFTGIFYLASISRLSINFPLGSERARNVRFRASESSPERREETSNAKAGGAASWSSCIPLPLTGRCCRLMQSRHRERTCCTEAGTAPGGRGWALPRPDGWRGRSQTVLETSSPPPGKAPIHNESPGQCQVPRPWLHWRGREQFYAATSLPLPQSSGRRTRAGLQKKRQPRDQGRGLAKGAGAGFPLLSLRKAPKMAGGNSAREARRRHRGRPSDSLGQPTNCPQHPHPAGPAAPDWLSWPSAPCRGGAATQRPRFPPRWRACAQTPLESI